MEQSNISEESTGISTASGRLTYSRLRLFAIVVGGLALLFIKPLIDLINLALRSELYSHVPLIPCVSLYFFWKEKERYADEKLKTSPVFAALTFVVGLGALAFYWLSFRKSAAFNSNDYLSLTILAFVCFAMGAYLLLLGKNVFSTVGFPVAFLLFLIPFPMVVTDAMEAFFQHTSASAAYAMLQMASETVFRTGLQFRLPGITIAVAPECSGIRSTVVLFITSLIAGQMFLRSPWRKTILTLFVIPLAILRNGFRIFTIAELCIHVGPEMIDSPIHHRGGPIFFLLSLIPFFALLVYLQKSEQRRKRALQGK